MAEKEKQSDSNPEESSTKRLYRTTKDKMLCGVCGGVADYFSIDSSAPKVFTFSFQVLPI